MKRSYDKRIQRNQGIASSVKGLLTLQVCIMLLILVNSAGHVGFGKAIIQSMPVLVSTVLITVSVRAAANENESGARNILSLGMLVVAMSALVALRWI